MKVISAELVQPNKRERISGGVQIEFCSLENVKDGDYFQVKINEHLYDFKAISIKISGKFLKVTATEVGYWAQKISHKGIDLRDLIDNNVISVTDDVEKKNIYNRSCYC